MSIETARKQGKFYPKNIISIQSTGIWFGEDFHDVNYFTFKINKEKSEIIFTKVLERGFKLNKIKRNILKLKDIIKCGVYFAFRDGDSIRVPVNILINNN